jgi:hypothetical protein
MEAFLPLRLEASLARFGFTVLYFMDLQSTNEHEPLRLNNGVENNL